MRGDGEHRVAFGPTKQTPTGPAGQHQSVAPNPTRRTLKSSRPKSREENTPTPSRPTDQDKRSVAPNQTGERSDGRPQSQLKNQSRHSPSNSPRPTSKGALIKWAHKATASKVTKSISKGESKRVPTTHALQKVEVSISGK